MSKTITNDLGEEEVVYTQAELDAQLAEKDAHVKTKLDEFTKGKGAQELKDQERDAQVAEAKAKADEAAQKAAEATSIAAAERARHQQSVTDFALAQFTGGDTELNKKIMDAMPLVNLEIKDDKDILERVRIAATIAGLAGNAATPQFPAYGGMAPQFNKNDGPSDADHEAFLAATGLK